MNKKRRHDLQELIRRLDECRAALDRLVNQESDALDNIPENLETSELYEEIENILDELSTALDLLDDVISTLNGI